MIEPPDDLKLTSVNDRNLEFFSQLAHPDSAIWELIFDSMPEMIALIDLNNVVVKANLAMQKMVNVGEKNLIGHACYNLMHQDGCSRSNCPHLRMLHDNQSHSIEIFEPKFGLYLNISTTPIFDSDHNLLGSLHIARDITLQKESEARLKKYNDELRELNQSKDKFFSIVAHDLRSPFQGMLGFTDLILDQINTLSKEEIRYFLQKVRDSSYNTFSLLENLLNWSRLQTGRMQFNPSEFDMFEAAASILSLLDSNAQSKNISLINNISNDHTVFADYQMVHSILLNLITNAIKFTYPGGTITIDAKVKKSQIKKDKTPALDKTLEISVTDTGTGMSPEAMEKIFKIEDHYTIAGTANEQGAGLGLLLVKEMVEKHGGNLSVISHEGQGSTFTFSVHLAGNKL